MPKNDSAQTIFIVNPAPEFKRSPTDMMSNAAIPLEALKANMKALLRDCQQMFEEASETMGGATLSHVDLSLAIAVDGSVGLFGCKLGGEATGGITVRLEFKNRTI